MSPSKAFPVLLAAAVAIASGCRKAGAPARAVLATIVTKTGIEMVRLPAGEFVMGDDAGQDDEKPAHRVRVAAFYVDTREVTQKAYQQLTGTNPSKFKAPDRPVEQVSWRAAVKYCNLRSLREGFRPCYDSKTLRCDFDANGYRLPTEAEWEYACRAGTATAYSFGSDPAGLPQHGWFKDNAAKTTHPVAAKPANPWGLHDMHGNVAEWCNDFYDERSYANAAPADPRGPAEAKESVLRGGSWRSSAEGCRSAARSSETPGFADACFGSDGYGLRCVRKADGQ